MEYKTIVSMLNRWTICLLDVMFFPWYEVSGRLHLWETGLSENRLLLVTTNWERDDQPANFEVSWNRGTPSHHPFLDGVFPYKPTIFGYPHWWSTRQFQGQEFARQMMANFLVLDIQQNSMVIYTCQHFLVCKKVIWFGFSWNIHYHLGI